MSDDEGERAEEDLKGAEEDATVTELDREAFGVDED